MRRINAYSGFWTLFTIVMVFSLVSPLVLQADTTAEYNARIHRFIEAVDEMAREILSHGQIDSPMSENLIVLSGSGMVGPDARAWRINNYFSQRFSRAMEELGDGAREVDCHSLVLFHGTLPGGNTQDTQTIRKGVLSYVRRYCRDIQKWAEENRRRVFSPPFAEISQLSTDELIEYYRVWAQLNSGARGVYSYVNWDARLFEKGARQGFLSIEQQLPGTTWIFKSESYLPFKDFTNQMNMLFAKWSSRIEVPKGTRMLVDTLAKNGDRLCQRIPVPASAWATKSEAERIALNGAFQNGKTVCEMAMEAFLTFDSTFEKLVTKRGMSYYSLSQLALYGVKSSYSLGADKKEETVSSVYSDWLNGRRNVYLLGHAPSSSVTTVKKENTVYTSSVNKTQTVSPLSADVRTSAVSGQLPTHKTENSSEPFTSSILVSSETTAEYEQAKEKVWGYYQTAFISNGFGYVYSRGSFESSFAAGDAKTKKFLSFLASFSQNVEKLKEYNNGTLDEKTHRVLECARALSKNLVSDSRPQDTFFIYMELRRALIRTDTN